MPENAFAEAAEALGKVNGLVVEGEQLHRELESLRAELKAKIEAVGSLLSEHKGELERVESECKAIGSEARALHGEYLAARTSLMDMSGELEERQRELGRRLTLRINIALVAVLITLALVILQRVA